jgi:hypothetical protein
MWLKYSVLAMLLSHTGQLRGTPQMLLAESSELAWDM